MKEEVVIKEQWIFFYHTWRPLKYFQPDQKYVSQVQKFLVKMKLTYNLVCFACLHSKKKHDYQQDCLEEKGNKIKLYTKINQTKSQSALRKKITLY